MLTERSQDDLKKLLETVINSYCAYFSETEPPLAKIQGLLAEALERKKVEFLAGNFQFLKVNEILSLQKLVDQTKNVSKTKKRASK